MYYQVHFIHCDRHYNTVHTHFSYCFLFEAKLVRWFLNHFTDGYATIREAYYE